MGYISFHKYYLQIFDDFKKILLNFKFLIEEGSIFVPRLQKRYSDRLAQLVEQRPFKAWALGSSPRAITKSSVLTDWAFLIYELTIIKDDENLGSSNQLNLSSLMRFAKINTQLKKPLNIVQRPLYY